jgi:hypothetical protein
MSTPTTAGLQTIPAPQPQPVQTAYGLSLLNLLPEYGRDSYFAAAGVQAPTNDPAQPVKTWVATEDANGSPIAEATPFVTFNYWIPNGNNAPTWGSFTITGAAALAVNIPGLATYPPYQIAPTPATQSGDLVSPDTIPPDLLSTMAQALALAENWGMTPAQAAAAVADTYDSQFAPYSIDYNGETRQYLTIDWNGILVNVGQMLQTMYAAGVGAPGSWNLNGSVPGTNPTWESAQPGTAPTPNAQILPVPQRALLSNEVFIETLMAVEVGRTDLAQPTGGTGGGLTSAQAQQLASALDGVNTLLALFGKPPAS